MRLPDETYRIISALTPSELTEYLYKKSMGIPVANIESLAIERLRSQPGLSDVVRNLPAYYSAG